jgi:hypothetical protein
MGASDKNIEPTIRRIALVALIYLIPSFQAMLPVDDPDIWWHLRTGEWIVAHHAVPFQDYFSAYGMGKPWLAYSWPFEVLVYFVHAHFGLVGIVYFTVAMALAIGFSVHRVVRLARLPIVAEVILTAAALAAMKPLMTPRPWLFTILFFSTELILIHRAREEGKTRWLWFLPLIFVVWANLHVQFIYGLALLGLLLTESLLLAAFDRSRYQLDGRLLPPNHLFMISALSFIATLVSPYHMLIYRPILEYIAQTGAFQNIDEFHPMFFRSPQDWIVLGLTLAAVFALGRQRKWLPFPSLLLLLGVLLGFRARRDVWVLLLASVWVIGGYLRSAGFENQFAFTKRQILVVIVLVSAALYALGVQRQIHEQDLQSVVAKAYPVAAAAEVRQRKLPGPLFNTLDWGGFLIWSLPELPVAIDGRTNLYGDERLESSLSVWQGYPGWETNPELLRAKLIIADHNRPLTWLLRKDSRYRIVYEDGTAVVFVQADSNTDRPNLKQSSETGR